MSKEKRVIVYNCGMDYYAIYVDGQFAVQQREYPACAILNLLGIGWDVLDDLRDCRMAKAWEAPQTLVEMRRVAREYKDRVRQETIARLEKELARLKVEQPKEEPTMFAEVITDDQA